MLQLDLLRAEYGPVCALDGVSLTVEAGQVTAVLGANGAGKTTLLRTVSGLVRPSRGSVVFDGTDITRKPVEEIVRLGIAHVPEGRGVITELTVEENLRLGGLYRKRDAIPPSEIYEMFPPLLERCNQPASRLSGGERQMLSIGRALAARPRALLLDEPSLGLAPLVVAQIGEVLRRVCREEGMTLLLVEQSTALALRVTDRAYVIETGQLHSSGPTPKLLADDQVREAYLGTSSGSERIAVVPGP
jgi:branched-chain amino acid transport system ATP-binding protein